uniref:Uncharacterized protein n=1 Tax=Romanomermis culicivorax TaxID=13658 RepID=A0A915KUN8_ROMCU
MSLISTFLRNDTKRLVYIRQGENMRNVDLSYRDFTIGTNAIVQKETVVPFRRQWFYMVPCTTDKVQFVTYKKARALAAFPQTSNSDGSYNLTCNASQIGAEEQLFGITPEGVIYNEGSTGIRILSTMNNVESTQGQVHLTLLTVSTVPNELITWRVTPVNPATAPQMPTGPTLPELIARLKNDDIRSTKDSRVNDDSAIFGHNDGGCNAIDCNPDNNSDDISVVYRNDNFIDCESNHHNTDYEFTTNND